MSIGAANRAWKRANQEKVRQYRKSGRVRRSWKRIDEINAYSARWNKQHPERRAAINRRYYLSRAGGRLGVSPHSAKGVSHGQV